MLDDEKTSRALKRCANAYAAQDVGDAADTAKRDADVALVRVLVRACGGFIATKGESYGAGLDVDTLAYTDRLVQLWAQRWNIAPEALDDFRIQLRFAAGAVHSGEAPRPIAEEQVAAIRALVGTSEGDEYLTLMGYGADGMERFGEVVTAVMSYGIPWAFRRAARVVSGTLDVIATKRGASPAPDAPMVTCTAGVPHKFSGGRDVMTCVVAIEPGISQPCGHGPKSPCHAFGPHKFEPGTSLHGVTFCNVCGLGTNTEDHRAGASA